MYGRARCIFSLQVDRDLKSGAGRGGSYKQKFTVFSNWPMRKWGLNPQANACHTNSPVSN